MPFDAVKAKSGFGQFLQGLVTGQVVIPPAPEGYKQFILLPVSSGMDSTAVAIVMAHLYPDLPITYVFTDTGNEVAGTAEALDKIEAFVGRKLFRITPAVSLVDKALEQGSFIPSQRARWCTQQFKALPFKRFIKGLKELHGEKSQFISLVGVRADEPQRTGIEWESSTDIVSVFPLQQLGLGKPEVNQIVNRVLGIPSYYAHKSRSGCEVCIYSRRSEIISMSNMAPETYKKASLSEQLPADYKAALNDYPASVTSQTGLGRNWLMFPTPSELAGGSIQAWENEMPVVRRDSNVVDMFSDDSRKYFVAVEHHTGAAGVHFQKLINYSSSLAGLKKSLKFHSLHRQQTHLLWGENSASEVAAALKLAIYIVEIHDAERLLPPKPEGVFTWQNDGTPLDEIAKTTYLLEQALLVAGLKQDAQSADKSIAANAKDALTRITINYGDVLHGSLFDAPAIAELVCDIDIEDAPVMCNACSR